MSSSDVACPNATAPIDVSLSNITGKCDLKCAYSFAYQSSMCVATNRGDYLSLAYDKATTSPVQYNASKYDVQSIRLYTPSLHSFNGSKQDAELIIVHSSKLGRSPLLVCVPVRANNSSSPSATFFQTLVDTVASQAPSEDESATINVSPSFSLDALVPRKPFFSYTATEPYQPCSTESVNYIVFSDTIDITPDSLDKLNMVVRANTYSVKNASDNQVYLFYNEKGANPTGGVLGGDVYIDCSPVGASEDTTDTVQTSFFSSSTSSSLSSLFSKNSTALRTVLGSLFFVALLFLLSTLLKWVKPS